MSLLLVGLNHKTASVELREQLAFTETDYREFLPVLANGVIAREALVLSTCNRVEILVEADEESALPQIVDFLANVKKIAPTQFADHLYYFSDADAARHLFRVASSLDSMIVGETQILGQVKQSYKIATEAGTTRRVLHKLLHHAIHTAKRVRTETRIASSAVSLSSAAVELARKTFGKLENKTVLLIGAGEMAELAAKHLIENGAGRILIANRTYQNAARLALEFTGEVVALENLALALPQADIVICSTAAESFLITAEMTAQSQELRHYQPSLFIDISVPRNVAPDIVNSKNAFLYSVDDLETVVTANLSERQNEAVRAEAIVEQEVAEFWQTLQTMNFGETLGRLREKMQQTARLELEQQRSKLGNLTAEQEAAVEKLLISTVNQIAHPILYGLRQSHEYGAADFAETLCDLLTQVQNPKSKLQSPNENDDFGIQKNSSKF